MIFKNFSDFFYDFQKIVETIFRKLIGIQKKTDFIKIDDQFVGLLFQFLENFSKLAVCPVFTLNNITSQIVNLDHHHSTWFTTFPTAGLK